VCFSVIEQTENGLVETVAVLISMMPRMRPELKNGKLGECFKAKPDFMKVLVHFSIIFESFYLLFLYIYIYIYIYIVFITMLLIIFYFLGMGEMARTNN
jgi:hypothetical protein